MRILATALVVALTVLAGCTSPDPPADELQLVDGTTVDLGEGVSETEGAIAGYVVDEAIRPLTGVTLSLLGGKTSTTDDRGFFHFPLLAPGFYAVSASATGFLASQGSADVVAGETSTVKLQLVRDLAPQPYHETYPFDAYMQAWATIGQFAVEIVADGFLNDSSMCDCSYSFIPGPNLSSLTFEAFWEPTAADPMGLGEFYWEVGGEGDSAWYQTGYCTSPCHAEVSLEDYTPGETAVVRITGPDFWVAYQQQVHVFTTLFYNGPGPEGFSIADEP